MGCGGRRVGHEGGWAGESESEAGDDDRHLVMTHGNNPGREKAEAAAQAVGGKAIQMRSFDLPPERPKVRVAHVVDQYNNHIGLFAHGGKGREKKKLESK